MKCPRSPALWVVATAMGTAVAACGTATPAAETPSTPEVDDEASHPLDTPGAKCLANARAPREPNPEAPEKIEVAHVLVRHDELDRDAANRSREDACLRALEALEALEAGTPFDEVVAKYSDERGAADRGGSLGRIGRDEVHPEFGDAAWALDVDELSYVVESPAGFHVILRKE